MSVVFPYLTNGIRGAHQLVMHPLIANLCLRVNSLEHQIHGQPTIQRSLLQMNLASPIHAQRDPGHGPDRRRRHRIAERNNTPCYDCQMRRKRCIKKTKDLCERCESKGLLACKPRPTQRTKGQHCSDSEQNECISMMDTESSVSLIDHEVNAYDEAVHKSNRVGSSDEDVHTAKDGLVNAKREE